MILRSSLLAVVLGVAIVACERSPAAPTSDLAVNPAAAAVSAPGPAPSAGAPAAATAGRQEVMVTMQDACDPETFDAAIEPGTCIREGGVTFDRFVAQLTRFGFINAWHFSPPTPQVRVGETFVATNRGGEVHTFTEVAEFGGGIVPFLNDLAHQTTVAPECGALEGDDFVAPGATYREEVEHTGTVKFQCCIHPWMRLEAQAKSR
jgi:plastocyanin